MGRASKQVEGVFTELVETEEKKCAIDIFIEKNKPKNPSESLEKYLSAYSKIVEKVKKDIDKMAAIEEIIMQIRSKENMTNIKVSFVRDYIYVRCPFYRKNKVARDIRVIVDKIELWADKQLDKLETNKEFIAKAKIKLAEAMDVEINENILLFKENFKINV